MEYALHEIGLGGCGAIHKYWIQGIQDYAVRLDQEDMEMIKEYRSFIVSIIQAALFGTILKSEFLDLNLLCNVM